MAPKSYLNNLHGWFFLKISVAENFIIKWWVLKDFLSILSEINDFEAFILHLQA